MKLKKNILHTNRTLTVVVGIAAQYLPPYVLPAAPAAVLWGTAPTNKSTRWFRESRIALDPPRSALAQVGVTATLAPSVCGDVTILAAAAAVTEVLVPLNCRASYSASSKGVRGWVVTFYVHFLT